MKIFKTELAVRAYELDAYGHVNNATYLNYAEFARWNLIEQATGKVDYFESQGIGVVVARVEIDYRQPCRLGDWLVVETQLVERRPRVLRFHQIIKKREPTTVAAELMVTLVGVDPSGQPMALPDEIDTLFR